jgi:hypothetical protein
VNIRKTTRNLEAEMRSSARLQKPEISTAILWVNVKGKGHVGVVHETNLEKQTMKVRTGLYWLVIGFTGGIKQYF